jgi:triphosphoribosyl-dephospho-CoA synthetase
MGLSLFACGKLFSQSNQFEIDLFRDIIRRTCKDLIKNELVHSSLTGKSHGEQIFQKYGFSGARGEAESGLKTVFEFGLPQLTAIEVLDDKAITKCFLAIAANNPDTNILYRRDPDVLSVFQSLCKKTLNNFNDKNYSAVIDFCRNENISPGGSADLLAVTIFVWSVINENRQPGFTNLFSINDF